MAILDIKQKWEPYIKTATGYVKRMLSSKHVVMENKKDLETVINELNGNLYYKSGDSIDLSELMVSGLITGSGKKLIYIIHLPKRLNNIKSVSIVGSSGRVRQNGEYVLGSSTENHTFGRNQYNIEILRDIQAIRCTYEYSGTLRGTNNDVMSMYFAGGNIEFS